jgi:hypothetical protein
MSTMRCPVRDNILVEKISHIPLCVPLGTRCDKYESHSVPNGTVGRAGSTFSTNILSLTGYFNQHFSVDTTLIITLII